MKISRAIMVVSILRVAIFVGHAALADALKIGVISAKSGVFAIFGASGEKGAILAADEINADGGILGQKIISCLATTSPSLRKRAAYFVKWWQREQS